MFAFQRKVEDSKVLQETRHWLTNLAGYLLRVATVEDHSFLLDHVLRCPGGLSEWAAPLVQAPLIPRVAEEAAASLDFCLAQLAVLLAPIRERCGFLSALGGRQNASLSEPWVVMDDEGAEDDSPSAAWLPLPEEDVITLINQIPLESLFRHLVFRNTCEDTNKILKVFAVLTSLVNILKMGLDTYCNARYKQLRKLLCRLLSHVSLYAADYWSHQRSLISQSQSANVDASMLSRVQVEFDALYERCFMAILYDTRCWQFLADLPYASVSLSKLWHFFGLLATGKSCTLPPEGWPAYFCSEDTMQRMLHDRVAALPELQVVFLLATWSNMAQSRTEGEEEFVATVTACVFQLCVACPDTREKHCKSGRDLLALVAAAHPQAVFATLLANCRDTVAWGSCVYLFRALPLSIWAPTPDQLSLVLSWLGLDASAQSAFARLLLSRLNWGFGADGSLHLPAAAHLKVSFFFLIKKKLATTTVALYLKVSFFYS